MSLDTAAAPSKQRKMSVLRDIFHRLSVKRREHVSEPDPPTDALDALDSLPSRPTPRRPVTSVSPNPQSASSFFKLPPELRQQIYRLIISGREIHLDMRYSSTETSTPHSTKGATIDAHRRWRWRASTCHRRPATPLHSDACPWADTKYMACGEFDTPCDLGTEALSLLLCCRLSYREVVDVLYAENTFHVQTGAMLLYTDRLLPPERSGAITSLIYRFTPETTWYYAEEHLRLEPGEPAYISLLSNLPKSFPSLKKLQLCLSHSAARMVWRSPQVHPDVGERSCKEMLLQPVDAAVNAFQQKLDLCALIMDEVTFAQLFVYKKGVKEEIQTSDDPLCWQQFWRSIAHKSSEEAVNTGYWVRSSLPVTFPCDGSFLFE